MRVVQKYIADDGLEFSDEAACARYESVCAEVEQIMATLAAVPDLPSCEFANGAGYLQHDPATAKAARTALLAIANRIMPHKWFEQSITDESVHPSWAGRLIGEMNEKCMWKAWRRFECMTPDFREFGQSYFVSHPGEAKDVCLNGGAA